MNGIEIVFNNQTDLVLLLHVKTLCGIGLCSFNKVLNWMQIINSLDSRQETMFRRTSHGHLSASMFNFSGSCLC